MGRIYIKGLKYIDKKVLVKVKNIPLEDEYISSGGGHQTFTERKMKLIGKIVWMYQRDNDWLDSENCGYFAYRWVEFISQ